MEDNKEIEDDKFKGEFHERDSHRINDIVSEISDSFLDYSMSVITSRAIPDLRDGLKPVHRRILWSMFEEGNTPDKPHKKSATTVGYVMGHYHPHGDSSIYDAMVRLAQDFNQRYMLVDGHGNFGNIEGDGAAAYRYTEARLSKIWTRSSAFLRSYLVLLIITSFWWSIYFAIISFKHNVLGVPLSITKKIIP